MTIRLSLVIPAFNESSRLAAGFDRLRPVLESLGPEQTEVIVVDDGSSDDTGRVASEVYGVLPHARVVRQPENRGKGAAVRLGISLAEGENVITADADMSIDPRHFPAFVAALAKSNIAPGSRVKDGRIRYDSPLRTVAGEAFSLLVRHYTHTTIRDTQCGAKGFQRGPARILAQLGMIERFAADAEMFYLASELGLTIEPIPVTWQDVEGSSVHVGRDSLNMIKELRHLRHTRYENPVIVLDRDVETSSIVPVARSTRSTGLVVARGSDDALVVLARDGALAAVTIADALGGTVRTATLAELARRTYDAV